MRYESEEKMYKYVEKYNVYLNIDLWGDIWDRPSYIKGTGKFEDIHIIRPSSNVLQFWCPMKEVYKLEEIRKTGIRILEEYKYDDYIFIEFIERDLVLLDMLININRDNTNNMNYVYPTTAKIIEKTEVAKIIENPVVGDYESVEVEIEVVVVDGKLKKMIYIKNSYDSLHDLEQIRSATGEVYFIRE